MTIRLRLFPVVSLLVAMVSHGADPSTNATPPPATPLESTTTPASTAAPAPATATDAALNSGPRPTTYTVVSGDTLWDLSHKFNTSISALKKLNKLKKNNLKPGQVLKVPPARAASKAAAASDEAKPPVAKSVKVAKSGKTSRAAHHAKTLVAQPLQDFDIPPSTFASCPAPPSNGPDASVQEAIPALAKNAGTPSMETSPSEMAVPLVVNNPRAGLLTPPASAPSAAKPAVVRGTAATAKAPPSSKSFTSALADFFHGSDASESGKWGNRFLTETRNLASHGIGYDQSWRPEGESHSWTMDCSNTARYLYQVTAGIQLPRTASDQYYYLHLQDKAWDVPTVASGFADCNFLRSNLKPGDLLFWENTYRPDRQPPITHVMIFLGTNTRGQWMMAGSQSSRGGQYNPHRSGPDVYIFDPTHAVGGYSTWMGLVRHQGRFCAYGRPLEADVKKLSVAAND